jgi:AcrR family transcriptional regulator
MSTIPCRRLRPNAEECRLRPPLTERDRKLHAYILEAAERIFIRHGRAGIVLSQFAYALNLAPATIRRHFADMDHIFACILHKHLDIILNAVLHIQHDNPDSFARRRAAYFQATRGICDIPTPMHFLLMRDRFSLPEDELEPIEMKRRIIGQSLARDAWDETLHVMDAPTLNLAMINAALRSIETVQIEQRENPPASPSLEDPDTPAPPPPPPPAAMPLRTIPRLDPALATMPDQALKPVRSPFRLALKHPRMTHDITLRRPGTDNPDWDPQAATGDPPKTQH